MTSPPDRAPPRRGPWGTILTGLALVALLALGTWQLQRLAWKTDLIARMEARLSAPAEPLPAVLDDPAAWEYRRVRLAGTFLNAAELYQLGPSLNGNPGWRVITPLLREDGGPPVLVSRGWVPESRRDPENRPGSQPEGAVTVEGIVRLPAGPGWFTPDNQPARNIWLWADLPAMAAAAGLDTVAPVLVEAVADPDPDALPVGGQTLVTLRNDHLSYALTWYGLAIGLVVIFILVRRERAAPPPEGP